ncbi:hypothetical protein KY335_02625, partial [Candidatus Woesearchaeota archaeon]|nr:hypothetical protein [Candidatus Woesearchaeota archaeon]
TAKRRPAKRKTARPSKKKTRKTAVAKARPIVVAAGKKKNPKIAALLEFIFGLFFILGIGHIYNGKIVRGVSYLIGYWILVIIEIVIASVLTVMTLGVGAIIAWPIILIIHIIIIFLSTYQAYKEVQ